MFCSVTERIDGIYILGGWKKAGAHDQLSWLNLSLSQTHRDYPCFQALQEMRLSIFTQHYYQLWKYFTLFRYSNKASIDWRLLKLWKFWWGASNLVIESHTITGGNIVFSNTLWNTFVKSTLILLSVLPVHSRKGTKDLGFREKSNQTEES